MSQFITPLRGLRNLMKGGLMADHIYISIDLKSFFASVECSERGLDPLTTNLVVADTSRTEKTICLAVSPSLKAYGIPGRARLFEVIQKTGLVNAERKSLAPGHHFTGESFSDTELRSDPSLKLAYIAAPPRMSYYMKYSTQIYQIYLRYIAPEDIHVYSIDEVFIDVTSYLKTYSLTARELAIKMISEVLHETGITATAGIGTNLYLAKIAMDVVAKHIAPDENGVRIAELDEMTYRRLLWDHRPLTDFWRLGRGYAKKLESNGLYTMGDVARCSLGRPADYYNENLLYKLFGVNAELLIDHAWGWEPCTIADIKAYRPQSNSMGAGQVLQSPYTAVKARLIIQEMTDQLVLDLLDKKLVTDCIVIDIGYDVSSLIDPVICGRYSGEVVTDHYGRRLPKPAHGSVQLGQFTSSSSIIGNAAASLYDRIINPDLLVRRLNVTACDTSNESEAAADKADTFEQLDLFTDYTALRREKAEEEARLARERRMQEAVLSIKDKYGKNAILKGRDLEEGATAIQRNGQIGGHKA
jgi:DNA polymerase V